MDPDSSSTGLNNTSSDSASASAPDDYHLQDFDSGSKQSTASVTERTNIDALDDTARDTLIAPLEDSHSSHSIRSIKQRLSSSITTATEAALHDELDFEGGDEAEDDDDDGEIEDDDGEIEDDDDEPAERGVSEEPGQPLKQPKPPREDEEEGELEESESEEDEVEVDAEPNSDLEDGEVDEEPRKKKSVKKKILIKTTTVRKMEEDLEEGEVTDDEDRNKDPKPICRFFGKGNCTWGSNCRFLHPGVTDKGLYTMFDPMRPLPIPPLTHFPMKTGLLGHAPPNFAPLIKIGEPVVPESSWERGLRHAKEIIKQSVKRKETDVDFEEKKMNLSLAQEEIDKENDYYNRKSPKERPDVEVEDDPFDDFNAGPPLPSSGPRDWPPPTGASHPPPLDPDFVRERVHHLKPGRGIREAPPRDAPIREAPPLHDDDVRMVRESALRRSRFQDGFTRGGSGRGGFEDPRKAEEWHDPWMRSHSPGGRNIRKASSLSKRSSYSSGSSRSSSRSSVSSKSSRSTRSSSNSSKSSKGSKAAKKLSIKAEKVRKVAPPRRSSPKPVRIAPPPPPKEEFGFGRRGGGNYGGPSHFERERERMRYAPPHAPPPHRGMEKDKGMVYRNPPPPGGNRSTKKSGKWSGSSRSRSRSRSFTGWSNKSSKSRSRSPRGMKRRSKFGRNRSGSSNGSRSRSPVPARKNNWSRSRSRSRSSSSTRSSSLELKPNLKRKRPMEREMKASDQMGGPAAKVSKGDLDGRKPARVIKSESNKGPQSKSQVKLTLKSQPAYKANKTVLDKLADDIDADEDSLSFKGEGSPPPLNEVDENENSNSGSGKNVSPRESRQSKIRRDELLKQLKAVEDAIAKKRSKL